MTYPQKIGRYSIKKELGIGGMANVYLAYDPTIPREVAVKVLKDEVFGHPRAIVRFQQEVQYIAKLDHYAIVPVYDYGIHEEKPFIVMRFMSGRSLKARLEERKKISVEEVSAILRRVVPALEKAHENGIIHRDIKPANILFDNEDLAYLSDFGIARQQTEDTSFTVAGTPPYMAPEQWAGEHMDIRTDVYQLGITLFELLTGVKPYLGSTIEMIREKHIDEPIPLASMHNPDLPPECDEILVKAMAKNPDGRYETPEELASDLYRSFGEEKINRFQVKGQISKTSSSSVYRAYDPQLGRDVALKVIEHQLIDNLINQQRFRREADFVKSLTHDNIVKVYDAGKHKEFPYLVMQLVEGTTLFNRLLEEETLTLEDVCLISDQLAAALEFAHNNGIIHRDIRPRNVFIDKNEKYLLTDFGTSYITRQTRLIINNNIGLGAFPYRAPEQWKGETEDVRTDIYQFGVMLFEMLTGRLPYDAKDPVELMDLHLDEPVPSAHGLNANVPPNIDLILAKAMAKDPKDRFMKPKELVAKLVEAKKQFILSSAYDEGRRLYRADRWKEAIEAFERVKKLQHDYKDVQEYIELTRTHQRKTESLRIGLKALDEDRWEVARNVLKPLGEYRGANTKAAEAERQITLDERYHEGLEHYKKKNLVEAKNVFDEIDQLDPGYKDVDDLRQEIEQQIDKIFQQGNSAFKDKKWQLTIDCFEEIKGDEKVALLLQQAEKEIALETSYEVGSKAYKRGEWAVAENYLKKVESLNKNYKDVQQLLGVVREKRRLWRRFNLDRIGLILGLLGIIFAIVFDFFGIGYSSLRQLPIFQRPTPTVELTSSLATLEECLAVAVPILTVADIGTFKENETISLPYSAAELELLFQPGTCPTLRDETFFTWSNEDMSMSRTGYRPRYEAPCNNCEDRIAVEVSLPESDVTRTFEFQLSIHH